MTETIDILVLDDEESIRWVMEQTLEGPQRRLHFAASAEKALDLLVDTPIDFALVDINLPGDDGLTFLAQQKEQRPEMLVAVMTGEGTMNHAVTAMKLGAFDYLTKPFDIDEVEALVGRAAEAVRQNRKHGVSGPRDASPRGKTSHANDLIIGKSRPVREIHKSIGRVAASDLTVLILGESGTGKELIARAVHQHSAQADEPFIGVNCAAIPRDLLESELFGHEKGAFTGAVDRKIGKVEAAGRGTLFLDEIGDMPLELQAKLLRVLQEQEFQRVGGVQNLPLRARVIAATNQGLEEAVANGRFRHDLLYRINAYSIRAEPLRAIREDIPMLCDHFMRLYEERLGMARRTLTPKAIERLMMHDWPGNVRELENVIKSLMITVRTLVIDRDALPRNIAGNAVSADLGEAFEETVARTWEPVVQRYSAENGTGLLSRVAAHVERPLIRRVLHETGGNQVKTAQVLGINRNTLRTKMEALGIRATKRGGGKKINRT